MSKARIVSDPDVLMRKPVVEGTRLTVELVLEPSISDEEVLERARESEAVLLTADNDFGELVSSPPGFGKRRAPQAFWSRIRPACATRGVADLDPWRRALRPLHSRFGHGSSNSPTFPVRSGGEVAARKGRPLSETPPLCRRARVGSHLLVVVLATVSSRSLADCGTMAA